MNKTEPLDVLLINMPFDINFIPSLGLSLLKEAVKRKGFTSYIKYYCLKFTKLIGEKNHFIISKADTTDLFGDWLFADKLFDNLPPDEEYISYILNNILEIIVEKDKNRNGRGAPPDKKSVRIVVENLVREIKNQTGPFLENCLAEIIAIKPKIVGFTSTFQQHVASLALAKRIKESLPETVIVFGGANCDGVMGRELIKKFPFVDIVVSGEGDEIFPELVAKITNREEYGLLPGVICRANLELHGNGVINTPIVTNMDGLPFPNYDDFFEQVKEYDMRIPSPALFFESSRGCWWGEKSHCTFCGLNGSTMAHRSKSADRALEEIKFLKNKYKITGLSATDNILDMAYFKDFVPALAKENLDLRVFYETKANLTKEQVRLLKAANITFITAGIESFNTHVLDLMKKGVKALQNIQLLKWCKELGITINWNIIWGFPGETAEDYYQMASLIPKINHLYPPGKFTIQIIHRFSPNFNYPERFGIKDITPFRSYNFVYPFEDESIFNLAYQFSYTYDQDKNFDQALETAKAEQSKWIVNYKFSDLFYKDQEDALIVFDLRYGASTPYFILYAKERFLFLLCDRIQPFSKIKQEYNKFFETEANEAEVQNLLDSLIAKNLMIRENNSYLSLAIPLGNYSPNQEVMRKLVTILKSQPTGDNQVRISSNNELLIELNG
jgi:ribosomal peptide maturation radical SAM protein 1